MSWELALMIGAAMAVVAALYSSVGHGGGSGYLAIMALFAVSPTVMRPSALLLNIGVAAIGTVAFLRRGSVPWRTLWPFAVTAVPMAFLGGHLDVPGIVYKPLLAFALVWSAVLLARPRAAPNDDPTLRPPVLPALMLGAVIGLVAGITGIGGGIFLSPVLLFLHWAPTRHTSGVAATFILLNSMAGLAGQLSSLAAVPWGTVAIWAPLVLAGGYVGSRWGSSTPNTKGIYRMLAVVLVIAAVKMLLTLWD